ncbi:MAG: aminotransferase class V-fold PLP-dependent enzyme [Pirellulales bacterium]|nr:aminotransferase class V-fold PLP-dependent enzyme [Pirellulales bacterium]
MRIYLDNAATSWPKPEVVYNALDKYQREVGAAAGRGGYRDAIEAQRVVAAARREVAGLIGAADPNRIVFGGNCSDALNLSIHGVLRPGDHVVATVCDHNSVLRPLAEQTRTRDVAVTYVGCDGGGYVDPDDVRRAIRPQTLLVIVTHGSNVTGAIQPLAEIAAVAKTAGVLVMVDAAQSVGHVAVAVEKLGVDLLAAAGHKGPLGPSGTGFLYVAPGVENQLRPIRQGGTGIESQLDRMPDELPTRYEAGSLNAPALAGLAAGVKYLRERTVGEVAAHEAMIINRLCDGLRTIAGVRVYGPAPGQPRGPVVSFSVAEYDPQEFAAALDSSCGIQCRAGLHCAPRMHEALGTTALGGAVRMSPGWSTSPADIDRTLEAVAAIAGA